MFRFANVFVVVVAVTMQAHDVSGALANCGDASPSCSDEANSICDPVAPNTACVCIATFVPDTADTACEQLTCTTTSTACTTEDADSYCDTTDSNKCKCKAHHVGTGVDCTRQACSDDLACKTLINTYCASGGSDDGCTCGFAAPAHSTTGVCTTTKCTLANAATTCTGSSSCIATTDTYECLCTANFMPGATACIQKPCADSNDCADDSTCTSDLCVCSSTFKAVGIKCKKECTGDGSGVCHDEATCTNSVCECNVNWQGNGANCNQLTCSSTTTTTCHPNSKCSSNLCTCATNFVTDGTMCRRSCTAATASTACSGNALCISDKCMCKQNYAGDGSTCTQMACSAATDCSGTNTACTSDKCECATGYEVSSTAVECVQSNTTTTATATTQATGGAERIAPYSAFMVFVGYKVLYSIKNIF